MQHRTGTTTHSTQWIFAIAASLGVLYALNIALGMLAVKSGWATWRLGDVGEFLLVLSCMAFFVAGLIANETELATAPRDVSNSNEKLGGE